ncbi:MAG: hypothetical protein N5P05_003661 [Chroococcopsis gigantea SAG 12.99]|jgi:hypothetical protein|nr:hypothetical protein [Chlorogloea purpurea SAG 13.99]MDV3002055.1 hypothetical protein [Chroococcopsis gigantea SAG 12.99]
MALIILKAWYVEKYQPLREILKSPHDLRLNRNSLLKSGLRADFLDDSLEVEASQWFQRFLEGEGVEFYIEGSGIYSIANIDLLSHEIYFLKKELVPWSEGIIYFSGQSLYKESSQSLRKVLETIVTDLNKRSRIPILLEETPRTEGEAWRLSDSQLKKIQKSLIFIADGTAIEQTGSQLILNPSTCVELGYAIGSKKAVQILLAYQKRPEMRGEMPFDLGKYQELGFSNSQELEKTLPGVVESLLQKYNLTTSAIETRT